MDTVIDFETHILQWQDYLVISIVMLISIIIGIYYRFSGGRQSTAEEYFSADNSFGMFPLSIALMASHISAVNILGVSGETYIHGMQVVLKYAAGIFCVPFIIFCYLPIFFEMKVVSIYEYLEKRFGLYMRLLVSVVNFIETMLLSGVTLYAPSLALEATTDLSSTMSILILAIICTFYSTMGGIKAVLVTDIFQGLLMIISLSLIIIIIAMNIDGGFSSIWQIAKEGDRLDFSNWSFDPTEQYTWWSLLIGGWAVGLSHFAVNQVQIQRLMTVKKVKLASQAIIWCAVVILIIGFLISFAGLSVYTVYKNCDPVVSGKIRTYDKILPYFTAEMLKPGLVGLIISGIFSASLSTNSSMMNSLAAVALEDYVKPLYRKFGADLSGQKAIRLAKMLTLINGVICLFLALLTKKLSTSLITTAFSIHGAINGPVVGIFTLGMISETANEAGSIIGMITALIVCLWAVFGQPKPPVPKLPISIDGCAYNNSIMPMLTDHINFNSTVEPDPSSYFYLYRISYLWYNPIGLIITLVVGYVASFVVQLIHKSNVEHDPSLFVPFLAARINQRRQNAQKIINSQLYILESLT